MSFSIETDAMRKDFERLAEDHVQAIAKSFSAPQIEILERITREILKTLKAGNKVLLCGNGGSAADAQHIAAEFIGRFQRERKSLPAIALTTDTSILTAVANDYDYACVFARQIEGLGRKGDLLIAISTSGNSANVLAAVEQAQKKEMFTVGFTGVKGGKLREQVALCFQAQSDRTSNIQEVHITALHAISEIVENVLFGS